MVGVVPTDCGSPHRKPESMKAQVRKTWDFEARHPRYAADAAACLNVTVEVDGRFIEKASLFDCSRSGIGLQTSEALSVGDELTIHVNAPNEGVHWSTVATVQWCRTDEFGWVCGCLLANELAWERLGELMISGLLLID